MPDPKTGSDSKKSSVNFTDWAWAQQIQQGPKLVLLALARHADANGCCYPGQERLAEMAGMGDRAVRRHLEWLATNGLVSREHRYRNQRRTSDYYRMLAAGAPTVDDGPAASLPDCSSANLPVDVTGRASVPVTSTGTVPVDLAPLPVDLAPLPVTSTGNSNKEVELLQRRTSPERTSPEVALAREPTDLTSREIDSSPDDPIVTEPDLGLFDIAPSAPSRSKAAPKGKRVARPLTGHTATADALVKEWEARQEYKPTSFIITRAAVVACLKAGWAADKIPQALDDVVEAGFSVRPGSLETALRRAGKVVQMPARNANGYQPYRDPEDESVYFASMPGSQQASGQ